jgi:cyanophycinase-like exopeptidase
VVPGFVVLPHFDQIERWSPGIVARRAGELGVGQVLVGIDEETALVSGDAGWRVAGRGQVWILAADGTATAHAAGTEVL